MSLVTFSFGGIDFGDILGIEASFLRPSQPNFVVTAWRAGTANKRFFMDQYDDMTDIKVPFVIYEGNYEDHYREIGKRLHNTGVQKLIFSDRPDRYYLAIPKQVPKASSNQKDFITGEIVFSCLFPYAQSINEKTKSSSTGLLDISNLGDLPTPVSFDVINHGENGFLGFANDSASIQIGNAQEQDRAQFNINERAIFNSFNDNSEISGWTLNTKKPKYPNGNALTGTFATKSAQKGDHAAYVNSFAEGNVKAMWYGPSIYKKVTASRNFDMNTLVRAAKNGRTGLGVSEIFLYDSNDTPLCGFRFRQISNGGNIQLYFYVRDTIVFSWEANTDWLLKDFLGNIRIVKNGGQFTFSLNSIVKKGNRGSYSYYDASLTDIKVAGVGVWHAKQKTFSTFIFELYMITMMVTDSGWDDVKNVFNEGDKVRIEQDDYKLITYLNDAPRIDLQDIGSKPMMLKTGDSTINILNSAFGSAPDVTARFRERWLS